MQNAFHACICGHCPPVGGLPVKLPPNDLKDLVNVPLNIKLPEDDRLQWLN